MRHRSETDKRTETVAPTCWFRESSCTCLRVEVSGTEAHIFPYQQMVTASLIHENAADVLRLAFSSHDVEITGRNLRELLVALQEFAVKWIRAVPERYQMTIMSSDQGNILRIQITAMG
jgi:hypothetical protein